MKKQQILLLIPLAIIGGFSVYTWSIILLGPIVARLQQYAAFLFFVILAVLFFKRFKKAVIGTGIFLLLGVCNLLIFTPFFSTSSLGMRLGPLEIATPQLQPISIVILILYLILNFDTLTEMYLDYQEEKQRREGL